MCHTILKRNPLQKGIPKTKWRRQNKMHTNGTKQKLK